MSGSYCCITWDLHKNYISNGFSRLQQNEEFVDMTIAAEGHLVKVHQNIIALASPYIKEMLHFASCTHPVVFLNNVSYKILSYILDYIYTGEVQIPTDMVNRFIETSKALRIKGVENVLPFNIPNQVYSSDGNDYVEPEVNDSIQVIQQEEMKTPDNSNYAAHITINNSNYQLDVHKFTNQENQHLTSENNGLPKYFTDECPENINSNSDIDLNINSLPVIMNNESHLIETDSYENKCVSAINDGPESSNGNDGKCQNPYITMVNSISNLKDDLKIKGLTPQYTISSRGALQLMLNRYIYCCHHQSNRGRKRRWRCVDYRKLHCPAIIDTIDENINSRKGLHSHGFHDNIILKKYRKQAVFSSISKAEETRVVDKISSDEFDLTKE